MGILAVSAEAPPDGPVLAAALEGVAPAAPVVILIHGFRYAPGVPGRDPHALILAERPERAGGRIVSWPRHLGLTGEAGLALGFGWQARGGIWRAYGRAGAAGVALAELIVRLRAEAPDRPVRIVAHSLGVRVALAALALCPTGAVERMVLIAGAAFGAEARAAMASPAGRGVQVLHVRGAENALFEGLLRLAFPAAGRTLGAGLAGVPGWVDLALDDPRALSGLHSLGHRVRPARYRICHWSGYTRPGLFGLYRAVLAGRVPMEALARLGPSERRGWTLNRVALRVSPAPDPR